MSSGGKARGGRLKSGEGEEKKSEEEQKRTDGDCGLSSGEKMS